MATDFSYTRDFYQQLDEEGAEMVRYSWHAADDYRAWHPGSDQCDWPIGYWIWMHAKGKCAEHELFYQEEMPADVVALIDEKIFGRSWSQSDEVCRPLDYMLPHVSDDGLDPLGDLDEYPF